MAKLRIFQSIVNDTYQMVFVNDPKDISQTDKDLMNEFGEPEVDFGGGYTGSAFGTNEFGYTLPDQYVKVISGLPFKMIFDPTNSTFAPLLGPTGYSGPSSYINFSGTGYTGYTAPTGYTGPTGPTMTELLNVYSTQTINAFTSAFDTLRANTDSFTNESVTSI